MKMKVLKSVLVLLMVGFTMFAYAQNKPINVKSSTIEWKGSKVIAGSHVGSLQFKSGSVVLDSKGNLKGGSFEVDMTTVMVKDLEAGKGKEKLEGHLKSDDFFSVEKFPVAKLKITKIKSLKNGKYEATADLTIKGITKSITFPVSFTGKKGEAKVTVDRTQFDIRYGSDSFFDNLGDKAISNNFELDIIVYI
ncbi:MAG TPA: YceI family protein [Saprospirales bacterium]|nr:YceI family protein [Saprospirales bacterium]